MGNGQTRSPLSTPALTMTGRKAGLIGEHTTVGLADGVDAGAGQGGVVDDQFRFAARGQAPGCPPSTILPSASVWTTSMVVPSTRGHDIAGVVGVRADVVGADRQPAFNGKLDLEAGSRPSGRLTRPRCLPCPRAFPSCSCGVSG